MYITISQQHAMTLVRIALVIKIKGIIACHVTSLVFCHVSVQRLDVGK